MKVIGLTGNSGTGKSAAAHMLSEMGAYVIDCDVIAHQNMEKGGIAYNEIVENFGKEILLPDGSINRPVLAGIVFSDKEKLSLLNAITHKYVKNKVQEEISRIKSDDTSIVIDAPLLIEAGLDALCHIVWVITASEEVKIHRITERDGITREAAMKRLKNQKDVSGHADIVTKNDYEDKESLKACIQAVYKDIVKE